MNYREIFNKIWQNYADLNPSVSRIHQLLSSRNERIKNDHVAFRTFNDPRINIDIISKIFRKEGYLPKGEYKFGKKHLFARHYEHITDDEAPRVFISELILGNFSEMLQKTVREMLDSTVPGTLLDDNLIFKGRPWPIPRYDIYEKLKAESEYAAWLYVFGYRANHFTINVNALESFENLESLNDYLKENGFKLNAIEGEIKGSENDLLKQSSTMADRIPVEFEEGTREIPACYYEFAERFTNEKGNLFSGFIAKSADKIFESTDNK